MNRRLKLGFRVEDSQRSRVREIWIFDAEYRNGPIGVCLLAEINRGGSSGVHARRVTRVGEKSHVALAGLVQSGSAGDFDVVRCYWGAFEARAGQRGEF